jgi:hypothetical protein
MKEEFLSTNRYKGTTQGLAATAHLLESLQIRQQQEPAAMSMLTMPTQEDCVGSSMDLNKQDCGLCTFVPSGPGFLGVPQKLGWKRTVRHSSWSCWFDNDCKWHLVWGLAGHVA